MVKRIKILILSFNSQLRTSSSKPRAVFLAHQWLTLHLVLRSLNDLFVDETKRVGRVGRALIEHVYKVADEDGNPGVYWHTQRFNHAAQVRPGSLLALPAAPTDKPFLAAALHQGRRTLRLCQVRSTLQVAVKRH